MVWRRKALQNLTLHSITYCHHVLWNISLKFPLYLSLIYSHCQGLLWRPRHQLWAYSMSQVWTTLYTAGLVRTPLSLWHSLAQDTSTSNLHVFVFLQHGTNSETRRNLIQLFGHTGICANPTPFFIWSKFYKFFLHCN